MKYLFIISLLDADTYLNSFEGNIAILHLQDIKEII